jgi:hypothetical protein
MESWGVFFLGLIAVSSLAQTAFLVRLAFEGRRVARRVDEIQVRLDRDIRPAIDNLNRFSQNLGEVSDLVLQQVRRIDSVVADTAAKIQETTAALHSSAVAPLAPVLDMAAFLQGLRRGYAVYRQLRGFEKRGPHGNGRNYPVAEDEHLFI